MPKKIIAVKGSTIAAIVVLLMIVVPIVAVLLGGDPGLTCGQNGVCS